MSSDTAELDGRLLLGLGVGSAAMNAVVFAVVGVTALESLPYGAMAGVFAGIGSYLFIPWFLQVSNAQQADDEEISVTEAAGRAGGSPRSGVFGLGLELGGIAMLAAGFAFDPPDPVVGVVAAFAVAIAVGLVGMGLFEG